LCPPFSHCRLYSSSWCFLLDRVAVVTSITRVRRNYKRNLWWLNRCGGFRVGEQRKLARWIPFLYTRHNVAERPHTTAYLLRCAPIPQQKRIEEAEIFGGHVLELTSQAALPGTNLRGSRAGSRDVGGLMSRCCKISLIAASSNLSRKLLTPCVEDE
jgi:hypothetical protein